MKFFLPIFILLPLVLGAQGNPVDQARGEVYVFSPEGLPLKGLQILGEGVNTLTNDSGLGQFTLPPGRKTLAVSQEGVEVARLTLDFVAGQTTEYLLTLRREGAVTAEQGNNQSQDLLPLEDRPLGLLSGRVVHIETGKPVAGVLVLLRGLDQDLRSDREGRFSAQIPQGVWTVSFLHPEYSTQTLPGVEVKGDQERTLDVELTPSALQLDSLKVLSGKDIKVQGGLADLLEESKNSSVVLSLLGAEQISRTGDSDAGQALARVTGLTVVDGKYVVIRGMGDRYSSTTMNGARLPSPDMDRRVVPLDLFPAAVIESLAVQKTYSADQGGEFAGGTVTIRTQGIPQDRFQRRLRGTLSLGLGWDPETLGRASNLGPSGAWDFLGIDDGSRRLTDPIAGEDAPLTPVNPLTGAGLTDEQLTALGRSFKNTWGLDTVKILPDWNLALSLRDKWDWGGNQAFGWAVSGLYKHGMETDTQELWGYGNTQGTILSYDYLSQSTSRNVDLGGLANLKYSFERLGEVESTTFFTRLTSHSSTLFTGLYGEQGDIWYLDTSWIEQSLLNQRLGGHLWVPGPLPVKVTGQYALSLASRYEPDHQFLFYDREDTTQTLEWSDRTGRTVRLFNTVEDLIHDGSVKVTLPLGFLGRGDDSLEAGVQHLWQSRVSSTRRFYFRSGAGLSDPTLPPEILFDPENIGVGLSSPIRFSESTLATDNYRGGQSLLGFFGSTDLSLGALRVNLGVRGERSRQEVATFDLFSGAEVGTVLETFDWLPALNLGWDPLPGWKFRGSAARTVNRPDLRELSPAPKDGPPGTGQYQGNPDLRRAVIWNGDLKVEQYLSPTETWSLGVFYKDFTDPIEIYQKAGAGSVKTPVNVPKALNWGVELEGQFSLSGVADFLRPWALGGTDATAEEFLRRRQTFGFWSSLAQDLALSGNLTWIYSQINYAGQSRGVTTSEVRPLQGQSPYVVNLTLSYKNGLSWIPDGKSDTTLAVSYNLFGPRLVGLGNQGFPDSYEQPFHQVDFTIKHRFSESWSLDFKAKNLLDPPSVLTAGDLVLENKRKGRGFSLGLKWDF